MTEVDADTTLNVVGALRGPPDYYRITPYNCPECGGPWAMFSLDAKLGDDELRWRDRRVPKDGTYYLLRFEEERKRYDVVPYEGKSTLRWASRRAPPTINRRNCSAQCHNPECLVWRAVRITSVWVGVTSDDKKA